MKKYLSGLIMLYALVACGGLYIIENIVHPTYGYGLMLKVSLFLIIPLVWGLVSKTKIGVFGNWMRVASIYGVILGLLGAGIIAITYLLLRDSIDWGAIGASMEARHITESTFLLIFLYIMFGNSLLEEFFFRGVVFSNMLSYSRFFAYITSSFMFSFYHMTIFQSWFSGWILALALSGLFLGGLFFAWMYEKTKGVWGAWIFHIFADLAILIIGYLEFFS